VAIAELTKEGNVLVECPGCDMPHIVYVNHNNPSVNWQWNSDLVKPTFSPSLLVKYTWGEEQTKHVCHSFIRDGVWEYLNDCTHKLAGQKVPLPEIED